jgi:hypothetical protein
MLTDEQREAWIEVLCDSTQERLQRDADNDKCDVGDLLAAVRCFQSLYLSCLISYQLEREAQQENNLRELSGMNRLDALVSP